MKSPIAIAMTAFAAVSVITVFACLAAAAVRPSTTPPPPAVVGAADTEADARVVTDVQGHVVEVMEGAWGLQPEDDEGTRYAPDELPEEFQVDGLAVTFSGEVGEIPPNARLWGTPLHLTDIRRRDE